MTASWVSTAIRIGLGTVWLWAGLAKMVAPDDAVRAVAAYRLVPHEMVRPMAWGLPFVEVALGVMLLLGVRTRVAATVSLILLAVFAFAVSSAWARGLRIDCGCFGGGGVSATSGAWTYVVELGRDAAFAVLAVWLWVHPRSRFSLEGA
jgi:uncharacterized membrane protein YphA (DoxX/SURF4 family)